MLIKRYFKERNYITMSIEIVLSSVVLSAIVSGVITYMIANKKTRLQYITDERKKWRNKIRKIAKKLHNASYADTLSILTELKVRLNAFGANECSKQYNKDVHIWQIINEIEATNQSKLNLIAKQEELIEYLALLLKADWERSKQEVTGNKYLFASSLYFCASSVWFFTIPYCAVITNIIPFDMKDFLDCICTGLLCILIMPLIQIVSSAISKSLCDSSIIGSKIEAKFSEKHNPTEWLMLIFISLTIFDILAMVANLFFISSFYEALGIQSATPCTTIYLLNIIGNILLYIFQANYIEQQFFYYTSITAIQQKYSDNKKQHALQNQQPSCGDKTICNTKQ